MKDEANFKPDIMTRQNCVFFVGVARNNQQKGKHQ